MFDVVDEVLFEVTFAVFVVFVLFGVVEDAFFAFVEFEGGGGEEVVFEVDVDVLFEVAFAVFIVFEVDVLLDTGVDEVGGAVVCLIIIKDKLPTELAFAFTKFIAKGAIKNINVISIT